jgi:DNA-binding GntR family transcriptional regulator
MLFYRISASRLFLEAFLMSINGSLTHDIYGQIREDLIACKLRPGQKLKTKTLCRAHNVSLGVVREALSRLTAEGFVLAEPQRGFRAPPLSTDEVVQLTDATINVETFCLRRAIDIGDLEWRTRVTGAYYRFSNAPFQDEKDPSRISKVFTDAYFEFRRALLSACDNKCMLKVWESLYAQTERYRQVCITLATKHVDLREGYGALVEAALSGDADAAVALLEQRLKSNMLRMRDVLERSILSNAGAAGALKTVPKKALRKARSRAG